MQHLLDFAGGGMIGAPPASNDPWSATAVPSIQVNTDPWSTGASTTAANPSPFSPAITSNDPWAPASATTTVPPTSATSNNPWDQPAAPTAVPTATG